MQKFLLPKALVISVRHVICWIMILIKHSEEVTKWNLVLSSENVNETFILIFGLEKILNA